MQQVLLQMGHLMYFIICQFNPKIICRISEIATVIIHPFQEMSVLIPFIERNLFT